MDKDRIEGQPQRRPALPAEKADELAARLSLGAASRKGAIGLSRESSVADVNRRLAALARTGNLILEWNIRNVLDEPDLRSVACGCNCGCTCGCYCYAAVPRNLEIVRRNVAAQAEGGPTPLG